MQVKLLTRTGTIQDMVHNAAKAALITRGNADKELFADDEEKLLRNIIKLNHGTILEHIYFTYSIKGLSRACLQELARHRHITLSVESTRYTLDKKFTKTSDKLLHRYYGSQEIAASIIQSLIYLVEDYPDLPNDELKYYLPEFWPTNLIMSSNVRELRHIINLRTAPAALQEFQDLAHALFDVVPNEFKFLLEDCVHEARTES